MVRQVHYSKLRTELIFLFYRYMSNPDDEKVRMRMKEYYDHYLHAAYSIPPEFRRAMEFCHTIYSGEEVSMDDIRALVRDLKRVDISTI